MCSLTSADPYVHHKLQPNTFSRIKTDDSDYVQRTNNVGYAVAILLWKKSTDAYRILMLGDSFTMGKGVSDDETFSTILERSLNAETTLMNGKWIEALNGGGDSYSPILSFFQLSKHLGDLQPDIVSRTSIRATCCRKPPTESRRSGMTVRSLESEGERQTI